MFSPFLILSCLLLLPITTDKTTTSQRRKSVLYNPTYPSRYSAECDDILSILPFTPDTYSKSQIQNQCQSRFIELYAAHKRHQEVLRSKADPIIPIPKKLSKKSHRNKQANSKLIILDLDETIMDQSTFEMTSRMFRNWNSVDAESDSDSESFGSMFNDKDLVMNINQFEGRLAAQSSFQWKHHREEPSYKISIGIFRPFLMEFIAFSMQKKEQNQTMHKFEKGAFDLVLYSAAISDLVIYQAVTMEIYYNLVYSPMRFESFELEMEFRFKFVISRSDDIRYRFDEKSKSKSLQNLMRMISRDKHDGDGNADFGDGGYESIVIIDDMSHYVWNSEIPYEMIDRGVQVLCLCPDAFSFHDQESLVKLRGFEVVEEIRDRDKIFKGIMEVLEMVNDQKERNKLFQKTNVLKWWTLKNPKANHNETFSS